MAKHDIPLGTLKDCFEFLFWLNSRTDVQTQVARNLHDRISKYFQEGATHFNLDNVKIGLSDFLGHVSKFYERLCYYPRPGSYGSKQPKEIVDAILECLPKFLAAIYFLEYCVNNTFSRLGGGGWQLNYPGYDNSWGGELQPYLRSTDHAKYGGILPGGFDTGEVRYNPTLFHSGYYQGSYMATDLGNILSKKYYNFYRSVFVISVIGDAAHRKESTANALSLVRTFCDIVAAAETEDKGKTLKPKLEAGHGIIKTQYSICWQDLKEHCAHLRNQFNKFFYDERFDFTGQSTDTKNLKTELATKTADWLRGNLTKVRGKLNDIDTKDPAIDKPSKGNLGKYFTDNFFPYGFTLTVKDRRRMTSRDLQSVMKDWRDGINEFFAAGKGLERLKEILDGTYQGKCRKPLPPKVDATANQGKKGEGAQNQGKKSEGAQNQGKKAEGNQNQDISQSGDTSSGSASGDSAQTPGTPGVPDPVGPTGSQGLPGSKRTVDPASPQVPGPSVADSAAPTQASGKDGATGPQGSTGDGGKQGSPGSGSTASSQVPTPNVADSSVPVSTVSSSTPGSPVIQAVQPQQPQPPPPAPPLPGGPGQPGVGGPSSTDSVTPGAEPGIPKGTVLTHTTSASGSGAGSTADQGTGIHGSGGAGKGDDLGGGQNGNQASDHSSSDGPTVPGTTAPGGGGGKGQQDPPKPIPCRNVTLQNLLAGGNNWCPSTYKPPNQVPYKFSDPDALNKIHEKVKNESHSASQNLNTPDILQNQNNSGHLTFGHSLKPTRLRPGDRLPTPPPQEKPSVLSGSEVEENEAYPMIMNDEYSDAISLEGNAKFDNSRDYRQLDEEQRGQELDDQWKKYYGDQELVNRLDRMKHDMELRQAKIKELQHARTVHDHKEQLRLEAVNSLAKSGTISGTAIERDHIVVPTSKSTKPQPTFIISKNHSLPTVKLDDYSMAKFTDVTGTVLTQSPKMKTKDTVSLPAPPTPYVTGKSIDDNNIDSLTSSYPVGELHPARPPPVDVEIVRPPAPPNKSKAYRTMGVPPVELIDQPRPPMPSARKTYRNDAENLQTMVYFDKSNPEKHSTTITLNTMADLNVCQNPWYAPPSSSSTTVTPAPSPPPGSDHMPVPNTVREMLYWFVGLNELGYVEKIKEHVEGILKDINKDVSQSPDALEVTGDPTQLTASHVAAKLTEACLYSASVLYRLKHKDISDDFKTFFEDKEKYALHYSPDPACLLCQLRDYVYACYHQLRFLRSQCSRDQSHGGWQDCQYGSDIKMPSPLQAFLTDASTSKFETHPFDPRNICRKSRVNMGFKQEHLPATHETGKHISTILTPTCGGDDPLLTLASYLNCLTRRTPRTTGELVSFFHNFGNSLYNPPSQLSKLGSALSARHDDCPGWDRLGDADLQAVQGIRGSGSPNSNHNHNHNNGHPNTLSSLHGCDITNAQCPQHFTPITYRAYALCSASFAHHYLSWTAYLTDRLWESLLKLYCDLEDLQCHDSKSKSIHQCDKALPLLYSHGFTPPEDVSQPSLTCSKVIDKLKEVVSGQPIASLMTAMDTFLYGIREPFIYILFTLWLIATLYISHTVLYRMDVLRIRSHLMRSKASHLIYVKALLTHWRKLLSLYRDIDYFDDEPMGQLGVT
ncbi:ribosome binding protein [Babesia ovata]|uniref:Ribosome binding protein n=1 Tax=Babesia ovata TaxID=189622 RepID=A0A2H6K7Y0_9APIC|nr:ribosome binding protein [Babesia ovata]GBE59103.1 ribosome binding protein [Babesia ovata]